MPRPGVGNPGNKGGRRKSAYQERADAIMLEKMFMDEMAEEDIQKKLASGKYSVKDVMVSKAFAGNEKLITAMFNKLFPDMLNIEGSLKTIPIGEQTDSKIRKLFAPKNDSQDNKSKS